MNLAVGSVKHSPSAASSARKNKTRRFVCNIARRVRNDIAIVDSLARTDASRNRRSQEKSRGFIIRDYDVLALTVGTYYRKIARVCEIETRNHFTARDRDK